MAQSNPVRADQKSTGRLSGVLFVEGDGAPKARALGRVLINPHCRQALSMYALEDEADILDPRSNAFKST
jgi:hypothetical protein